MLSRTFSLAVFAHESETNKDLPEMRTRRLVPSMPAAACRTLPAETAAAANALWMFVGFAENTYTKTDERIAIENCDDSPGNA